mmetsp:Transcript_9911/g.26951  ORF Transcript_9911/g.26951 Transcript_9911/m.26951 type:complete len:210 (+) Transcript_9911:445-1074(+)
MHDKWWISSASRNCLSSRVETGWETPWKARCERPSRPCETRPSCSRRRLRSSVGFMQPSTLMSPNMPQLEAASPWVLAWEATRERSSAAWPSCAAAASPSAASTATLSCVTARRLPRKLWWTPIFSSFVESHCAMFFTSLTSPSTFSRRAQSSMRRSQSMRSYLVVRLSSSSAWCWRACSWSSARLWNSSSRLTSSSNFSPVTFLISVM